MRLTPPCFRSSDRGADERSRDTDPFSELTIDSDPSIDSSSSDRTRGIEFVPESDSMLVKTIGTLETPATIDEIVDQLVRPRHPPLETWAEVHEQLHQRRLPALDDADRVEFDAAHGVVNAPVDQSSSHEWPARAAIVSGSVVLAVALLLEVSPLIAAALIGTAVVVALLVP